MPLKLDRALVTGAAGFIGSHLCEALLARGADVVGVDSLNDNYVISQKRSNLGLLKTHPNFTFLEGDITEIADTTLVPALADARVVFHLAGEPGVRASWGESFSRYIKNNIEATQVLLEAIKNRTDLRFVYASSSSVYGQSESFPTTESVLPKPVSPYGVTKLAAEHLTSLYNVNYGIQTVAVRYFTVYGPRQRPDMAFHIFCRAALANTPVQIYGDGQQTRDFTYVTDAVAATIAAAQSPVSGEVFNVGGGSSVSLREALDILSSVAGVPLAIQYTDVARGDVRDTAADTSHAYDVLGWKSRVNVFDGLTAELGWLRTQFAG